MLNEKTVYLAGVPRNSAKLHQIYRYFERFVTLPIHMSYFSSPCPNQSLIMAIRFDCVQALCVPYVCTFTTRPHHHDSTVTRGSIIHHNSHHEQSPSPVPSS